MTRMEKAEDVAAYALGGPLFFVVAAVTAAVMAVGLVVMTAVDRVVHH